MLYLSRHHLDIHSFPTRRSSDLTQMIRIQWYADAKIPVCSHKETLMPSVPNRWLIAAAGVVMQIALGAVYAWRDRKSTRLNSSHLGISYAVFCLKKKKTTSEH